ncbi:MAG TPA: pyrimidine 5'-nucleotidase [Herpetosiphonaceae bacterium]
MTLRIALYDLDNTLYPYSAGVMQAIDGRIASFVQERLQLSLEEASALRRSYFEQYGTTLRGLQQHHAHIDAEDYLRYVHDVAIEAFIESDERLDGLLTVLPLQKVIFTNSPLEHATRVLRHMGIDQHFSAMFDIRAFNFLAKPHIEAYHVVLQALGAEGAECVLFEDTAANLQPAKELGMTTVLITGAPGMTHPYADFIVGDVLEATQAIHGLVAPDYITSPPVTSTISPLT